jgi:hypothetical protein
MNIVADANRARYGSPGLARLRGSQLGFGADAPNERCFDRAIHLDVVLFAGCQNCQN